MVILENADYGKIAIVSFFAVKVFMSLLSTMKAYKLKQSKNLN
jgi:hypothetical protein